MSSYQQPTWEASEFAAPQGPGFFVLFPWGSSESDESIDAHTPTGVGYGDASESLSSYGRGVSAPGMGREVAISGDQEEHEAVLLILAACDD